MKLNQIRNAWREITFVLVVACLGLLYRFGRQRSDAEYQRMPPFVRHEITGDAWDGGW
jgi:hypothetical protein